MSPGSDGARFYAMERLNGNGKTGRSDDTEGMHQHTLDESDRIKKSSVNRHFLKEAKESRRSQVCTISHLRYCFMSLFIFFISYVHL